MAEPAGAKGRDRRARAKGGRSTRIGMATAGTAVVALVAAVAVGGCGSRSIHDGAAIQSDPPLLVPWNRVGNIALGGPRTRVEREYGSAGHGYHVLQPHGDTVQGYYRLHRSQVIVTFLCAPGRRARVHDSLLPDNERIWSRQHDPARPVSPDRNQLVRAPLAWLRLERVGQRNSVQLLGESRPRRAITSGDCEELLEALVLHLHPPRSCNTFLLRVQVRGLTRSSPSRAFAVKFWSKTHRH